ncbi:autoinducer 2 ABC transporter substrate-binding protein [Schaalia hyovaginalis]|uniref:autoinducer 2 ABC transporter substrate-binding protein n=1 Tax=Schaalia hyovaginalis TaxID=29316 RepID=UPI002A76690D|nr:autoinducer 2 ABC transporter substrate-binding protein [Schaalia hyovaginalis]MDY2669196.1 autoinducer 2 ABC transporter substrate-binding protein [Schaalia hyovaginalis]
MARGIKFALAGLAACVMFTTAACAGGNGASKSTSGDSASSGGSSSGSLSVAFVPKVQGIPFFEAMNVGGKKASEEFGFNWVYSGPTTADPAAQSDVVRSLIQQGVDALMLAPNDPDSMSPPMTEAQGKGIKVGTADTDAPNSTRELFVEQASAEGIGKALVDQISKAIGDSGEIAIVSCGQTAVNLNSWIEVINKEIPANHPNIKIVDTVYADEDQAKAVTMSKNLINANPNLKGLIGMCTTSAPGVAQAVQESGKIGQIQTVGVGTPKSMLPYLQDKSSYASILWNVEDFGYLTAWGGWMLAQGKELQPTQDVGHLKGVTYDSTTKTLLLGDPMIFTADNAGGFDY